MSMGQTFAVLRERVRTFFRSERRQKAFVAGLAVLGVVLLRSRHDYSAYQKQWTAVLQGVDPYVGTGNAYGPLHDALALLFAVHPKLPRLLFVGATLLATFVLLDRVRHGSAMDERGRAKAGWHLLLDPLLWVFVVVHGNNDGLLGPLVLFGVMAAVAGRSATAGLLLGLGTLLKLSPVFLFPFLAISRRRVDWRFAGAYLATTIAGFAAAWGLWGKSVFSPFLFNTERPSKLLSIFAFLGGRWSPLHLAGVQDVDFLSTPLLLAALACLFVVHLWRDLDRLTGAVLVLSTVLLLFKVGNHQFHLSLVLLVVLFVATRWRELQAGGAQALKWSWIYLGWIAFCTALYAVTEGYYRHFAFIRDIIGLPTFLVMLPFAIRLLRYALAESSRE